MLRPISATLKRQIDLQITLFACKGYHAFSIVEEEEFINLLKMLNPNYQLPSRKTVSNSLLPAMYQSTLQNVHEKLRQARSVTLTTDGWTNLNCVSFFSITAHFIDENGRLCSYLLECSELPTNHTVKNIAD